MTEVNKPLCLMTVDEFLDSLSKNGWSIVKSDTQQQAEPKQEKRYVYGIEGLAKLLGCSKTTAQSTKNSGILNGCYSQVSRKIVFDAEAVLNAIKR